MNKSVSGITKENNRSVRDIDPPNNSGRQGRNGNWQGNESSGDQPPRQSRNQKAATFGVWFIGIIAILLLFFLFSVIFSKTTVTVAPRTAPVSVDNTFTAIPAGTGTSTVDTLTYSITTVSDTRTEIATSSGTEYREQKAQGKITIYNEYSSEDIRLVANTRFKSPDGLIYRTQSPVTVPGKQGDQPGQITVPVTAAETGSSFNVENDVRFSVPGFAGAPQEGKVYANLATPINGGIAREVPIVASSTKSRIANKLQEGLRSALKEQLESEVPDRSVVYDGGVFFSLDTTSQPADSGAEIAVTGNLHGVTFDKRGLSLFLARESGIEATADTNLRVQDLPEYSFQVENEDEFTPSSRNQLEFSLSGNSLAVWQFNEQALARDLQNLQKSQISDVLKNYPAIQSAEINTRPFWKRALPSDPTDITIKTRLE